MAKRSTPKRALGLVHLVIYGVGTILGLGIYVLLGEVAGAAGMLAPFAFLVAAALAVFTALSYGELSARLPYSGGEVHYVRHAFGGRWAPMAVGWLIVLSAIVSTSTVVNGYVGYVQVFVDWPDWIIIAGAVLILGGVAVTGIEASMATIAVITAIEFVGLLVIVFVAGHHLSDLPARWTELVPGLRFDEWAGVLSGGFLAFFAFIGFEDMVNVAEEAKRPRRDMPRAILISFAILTVLYLLVAVIGSLALPVDQLRTSDAPLADMLRQEGERYPLLISAIGLVAIVNGVLVQIIMGARVLYGMGSNGLAPKRFGRIDPRTRTPVESTALMVGAILVLALAVDLSSLAQATNYILLTVFTVVNASLVRLQRRDPAPDDHHPLPRWVGWMGAVFSASVLVARIVQSVWEATF